MIGKALTYLNNQWPKLMRYLDDGRLSIDNNPVENAIRPFVIGRRNWLFSDTARGAKSSANLYSLIETAKANGLEPYAYLRHLFTELPKVQTPRTDRGAVAVPRQDPTASASIARITGWG
jgi:transposase